MTTSSGGTSVAEVQWSSRQRSSMMRNLNYLVLGVTSMFAAAALAQSHVSIKDGTFVLAQAGDPMASPRTSDKDKGGYHTENRKAKQDPARDSSSQVRKDSKQQPKDSGG